MDKILIFSLGDRLDEKSKGVTYIFGSKKYQNIYLLEVYFKELDFDKIICFGNSSSSWDYLYKLMYQKYYGCEPDPENIEIIREIRELEIIEEFFFKDQKLKEKIIIKYFEEDLEKDKMIGYIYKIKTQIENSSKLWIDLTGGKRDLPIFLIQLINLVVQNKSKEVDIDILYAKNKVNNKNSYEVIFLKDFIEKLNYTHDISPFTKYGCPLKFSKYLIDDDLKKYLNELYIYTQYNLTNELVNCLKNFKGKKWKYTVYIQKKIIETKIEQWKNLLSKTLEKDTLLDYHLELSNEPLSVIAKVAKLEDKNLTDDSSNENYKKLKNIRNSIVHAYNKKNLNYEELEKILEINFPNKKEKIDEILLVNIGDSSNYRMVEYKNFSTKTSFSFKALIKNNKFKKIFLIGLYSNVWNIFIDKWIEEEKLNIKREQDITTDLSETEFEKNLNRELKKLNAKFECIILNNSFSEEDRNKYFEKITEKLISNNQKYSVTYDFTYSYRDIAFINYLNLHCLELLGILKIKQVVYASIKGNYGEIKDMNKINSIMNLFKSIQEFKLYNKFSENIDVNENLKSLIKKVTRIYSFNQVTTLDSIRNTIENFSNIENEIEKDIFNSIKDIYVYKESSDKYDKVKNMIKKQLRFNNLAQALYLVWDLVLNDLIEDNNQKIEQEMKTNFLKKSNQYGSEKIYKFYEKYKHFSVIRKESAHINLKRIFIDPETIFSQVEECLNELDNLRRDKQLYKKIFFEYYKKEGKKI